MKCNICGNEIENIQDYNVFKNNSHIISEYAICDKCLNHIANGGKFVRVDNLALNIDSFGENLKLTIDKWISYKAQIGDTYTERGKQTLITQIKNQVKATSEEVVCAKIQNSIDHKWKGICWDAGTIPKEKLIEFFEHSFDLSPTSLNKESAKKYYLYLFRKYDKIEEATLFARQIYIAYKQYIENTDDEKYCMSFENFLKKNIPSD